jgi:hypothetical protein
MQNEISRSLRFATRLFRLPRALLLFGTLLMLASCGQKEETGPGDLHWDREVCERCRMAVSDPHYSAQVRGAPAGERTRLYFFDDLGCAVLWLDTQEWKDDPRTEMWVNDCETGTWLDAHKAHYLTDKITPMDFGLGARLAAARSGLDYGQAVAHIYKMKKRKQHKKAGMPHRGRRSEHPATEEHPAPTQPPTDAGSDADYPAPAASQSTASNTPTMRFSTDPADAGEERE